MRKPTGLVSSKYHRVAGSQGAVVSNKLNVIGKVQLEKHTDQALKSSIRAREKQVSFATTRRGMLAQKTVSGEISQHRSWSPQNFVLLPQLAFWDELSNKKPDLGRLNTIGKDINDAAHKAEASFKAALRLQPKSVDILRNYALFCLEIINDASRGDQLLMEAESG